MNQIQFVSSLRDFFHYGDEEHLKTSYDLIREAAKCPPQTTGINWENEEFIFNRLFVGPAAPKAPVIASAYIDPDEKVQGKITRDVREFYNSIGLSLHEEGNMPEDSLPFELDACLYLLKLAEQVPDITTIYQEFIDQHLALWLPKFTYTASLCCEDSVAVRDVIELMETWIINEATDLLLTKELS